MKHILFIISLIFLISLFIIWLTPQRSNLYIEDNRICQDFYKVKSLDSTKKCFEVIINVETIEMEEFYE